MGYCDPFTDRLCRDIRNDLSAALMASIDDLDLTSVQKVADTYRIQNDLSMGHKRYIDDRMARYRRVVEAFRSGSFEDPWLRALVLWDAELFFEVHETLEKAWMRSSGTEKLVLQAMIRAAGMYVQLDHGNLRGAASMAKKAVEALESHRSTVPELFDLDLLLEKLKRVDPVPPRLAGTLCSPDMPKNREL